MRAIIAASFSSICIIGGDELEGLLSEPARLVIVTSVSTSERFLASHSARFRRSNPCAGRGRKTGTMHPECIAAAGSFSASTREHRREQWKYRS